MAREKRNADASADSTAPKKRSKPINNFPKFHDGDVTIIIGDLELKLHSKLLIAKCRFFAHDGGCKRFVVDSKKPLQHGMDHPPLTVAPYETAPQKSTSEGSPTTKSTIEVDDYVKRSRAANEAFFRLLYNRQLSSLTPAEFRDVAILTSEYGCVQRIKDALIIAFFKANLGTMPFRDNPWAILYAAGQLQDEAIYHEAMVHIIGRGGLHRNDKKVVHPWSGLEIITQTGELRDKVRHCSSAAMRCCKYDDVASAIAAAVMKLYISSYIFCDMADPLQPEIYDKLRSLHDMEDAKELLDAGVLTVLEHLDDGLVAGGLALDRLKGLKWSSIIDEINYKSLIVRVNKGLEQGVSSKKALEELERLLANIKTALKPLFVGDRNVGYFTCVQISGPNPWEHSASSDSELAGLIDD
ncbi:hypothetical protein SLS58_007151 [Diplodia intermedia]|uniref:BTB domain-containing protein n=1 Tax=Diplodia intermedia TaxID=856260 RepID=A0ABR3TL09_9PEZI